MASSDLTVPAKTSHPIGFWFFFWGEFAERCSYYGMRAILALYMTERLGVDKGDAGTFMSLFIAACYFFPLIGGYLADNYFGKYWTIVGFSIPYVVGQFLVGIENKYMVFGALTLLAMGSGVIKPNISTLMGLTYDQQRPGQTQLRTSAFSWFYMSINIGAALSQFTMPWLRQNYGYQIAFYFPAGLMVLALTIFALGKRFYAVEVIERKQLSPEEAAANKALKLSTLKSIGLVFLLVMFFWAIFDQAASTWIFFANTYMDTTLLGEKFDGSIIFPMPSFVAKYLGSSSFGMSADAIQGFNPVFIILLVPVSVFTFKWLAQAGWKIRPTQKMILGFLLTTLSMVIMAYAGSLAGKVEKAAKLSTPEGFVILPVNPDASAEELVNTLKNGGDLKYGVVTIKAEDYAFNPNNKKGEFQSAEIRFGEQQILKIAQGSVDFTSSKNLIPMGSDRLNFADAKEVLFKSNTYSMNGKKLTIGDWNRATLSDEPGPEPKEVKDAPKSSVEIIDWVKPEERVSVWWQVLAYLVLTVAEILISVTGLELAFVAAPPSMKSFVTACWLAVVFLANFLINAPITQLYPLMTPAVYFIMLAGIMLLVTFVFLPVASKFNRFQDQQERDDAGKKAG